MVALENGVLVVSGVNAGLQGVVIRSIDGGRSWETTLTIPLTADTRGFQLIRGQTPVNSVVVTIELDPFHPNQVYAGSSLGTLFVGEQSAKTWRSAHSLAAGPLVSRRDGLSINQIVPSPHTDGEVLVITASNTLYRIHGDKEEEIKIPKELQSAN